MAELGWLTRELADVPAHDRWLSESERAVLASLRTSKRRSDWRLGRWAGKAAIAAWRGVAPEAITIAAADDGAPEARVEGQGAGISLSLSHRGGRALAVVSEPPRVVGCDLEAIEPRSPAFLREWLGSAERVLVRSQSGREQEVAANLVWTAKEAASKARRGGLRLNVRQAIVELDDLGRFRGAWRPLRVRWQKEGVDLGWWRADSEWVMALVSDPAAEAPPSELA
jgi:4'-phosphopantetheinyl transferase